MGEILDNILRNVRALHDSVKAGYQHSSLAEIEKDAKALATRLAQAEAELTQKLACIQVLASGDEPNVLAEFPAADDVRRLTHRLAKAEAEREQHERYVAAVAEERRFTEARTAELQALLNAEYPELVPATVAAISGALQKRIAVLEALLAHVSAAAHTGKWYGSIDGGGYFCRLELAESEVKAIEAAVPTGTDPSLLSPAPKSEEANNEDFLHGAKSL